MPFYEYECSACKHHLEALQKISDAPLKKCPNCGKSALKRLISAPVFRLKGSGWYETDFKSDSEAKRNLVGEEKEASASADVTDKADKASEAGSSEPKAEPKDASAAASKSAPVKPALGKKQAAKPKPAVAKKKAAAKNSAKTKAHARR